ncbi:hypothetical protein DYU11_26650 [Fibrisoma montanum]|uniref:PKD domain-containing protein n=1 Tax=Fibrisoma montanum TaxID=2305895 RepID=A0A418M0H2_9BACT|nr:hypothetical protein [Fibrisoma montanum]RIV19077.1 hypothetical protein DYU11_26650 [Fibrisoma montanum]
MIAESGQGKAGFYYHLEHCCQLVSETYGKPERTAWTNGDYVRLSHILFRKTSVQISPNTLKRIFGKIKTDSRYYPQKATRDALASYVGYPDWDHFVEAQLRPEPLVEPPAEALPTRQTAVPVAALGPAPTKKPYANRPLWLIGLAVLVLSVGGLLRSGSPIARKAAPTSAQLICKNPVGENPHSANLQIQGLEELVDKSTHYQIDFGDGKRKPIDTTTLLYNHYYEKPGRYFAVLKRGSQNLDTATVFLPTRGWAATAYMMYDTTRVYPIDIPDLFVTGKRSISATETAHAGIDTNRTFFIEFANTQATDIDADNFELTTHVLTSPTRTGVRCSQVGVTVYGESSKHSFEIIKPGCVYWSQIQLSEQVKWGQRDDLRFLGADLRTGGTLTLRVVKQRAHVFINGRQVYEASYQHPLHRVYGVNIRFAGIGTINSFSLKDLKTGKAFAGNF